MIEFMSDKEMQKFIKKICDILEMNKAEISDKMSMMSIDKKQLSL